MFNKEYPKSCTMFNISLEDSFTTISTSYQRVPKISYGSGGWSAEHWSGIFYTNLAPSMTYARLGEFGFRVGVYVQ